MPFPDPQGQMGGRHGMLGSTYGDGYLQDVYRGPGPHGQPKDMMDVEEVQKEKKAKEKDEEDEDEDEDAKKAAEISALVNGGADGDLPPDGTISEFNSELAELTNYSIASALSKMPIDFALLDADVALNANQISEENGFKAGKPSSSSSPSSSFTSYTPSAMDELLTAVPNIEQVLLPSFTKFISSSVRPLPSFKPLFLQPYFCYSQVDDGSN